MSYRTYVNDIQVFGNNEFYPEWIEFVKSQGIDVDADGCYDGSITDVMGAIDTIERIIIRIEKERRELIDRFESNLRSDKDDEHIPCINPKSLFDLRYIYDDFARECEMYSAEDRSDSLTDRLIEIRNNGYMFMPCAFLDACGEAIERDHSFAVPGHFECFKLKSDCTIKIEAR